MAYGHKVHSQSLPVGQQIQGDAAAGNAEEVAQSALSSLAD